MVPAQVAPLGVRFGAVPVKTLDWSGAKHAVAKLRHAPPKAPPKTFAAPPAAPTRGVFAAVARGLFGARATGALYDLATEGMPTVDETAVDARRELEDALRGGCARVVALAHRQLAGPLLESLRACRAALPSGVAPGEASPTQLQACKRQPFAQPAALGATLRSAVDDGRAAARELRAKCDDFLEHDATRRALLKPARAKAAQTLEAFGAMCDALLPADLRAELEDDVAAYAEVVAEPVVAGAAAEGD